MSNDTEPTKIDYAYFWSTVRQRPQSQHHSKYHSNQRTILSMRRTRPLRLQLNMHLTNVHSCREGQVARHASY